MDDLAMTFRCFTFAKFCWLFAICMRRILSIAILNLRIC